MCCGSAFWKGFLVFVLTFAGGVFVSSFFAASKVGMINIPAEIKNDLPPAAPKTQNNSVPDIKKCVPVDGNLKYEQLAAEEKPDFEAIKKDEKKRSLKAERKAQKNAAATKHQFYNSSKDKAAVKDLLHRERCFEVRDQK